MGFAQCCGYFGSTLIMLVSGIVFICLLVAYFPHIRTFFYKEGTCVITDTIYTIQYACECGPDCKAFYPCMLVYAKVNSSDVGFPERDWPVMVFDDDWQQIEVLSASPDLEERCSVRVCEGLVQNRDHVQRYRLKYGMPGTIHKCYFDVNSLAPRGAVFHQRIHWTLAFHVIFWPGMSFLFGVILCATVCYSRRCKKKKYGMRNMRTERF